MSTNYPFKAQNILKIYLINRTYKQSFREINRNASEFFRIFRKKFSNPLGLALMKGYPCRPGLRSFSQYNLSTKLRRFCLTARFFCDTWQKSAGFGAGKAQ